ncbi:hypothetical protein [Methylobacterium isbiliense]|uniref:hypothetical protein n=1 Tax=Methylobacterium isbiliense TaxID=315478 RepID=UPI001EE1A25D|nr:hypothetical protein [Methylobacterium isbiliense]MDN3625862.1 hypothetical protein [Methylobacterium isbiliense]
MTRNRVRRSFTVEVKGRGRSGSNLQEATKSSSPPPSVLWAGTYLTQELSRLAEEPVDTALPSPTKQPVEKVEARRVLPSLLVVEPIAVEPEPAPEREPRLPRVRRASERMKAKPKREAGEKWAFSWPPTPAPQPRTPAAASAAAQAHAPTSKLRAVKARSKSDPKLKAGERWKRRLPRACW